jgi:hypothetical protein
MHANKIVTKNIFIILVIIISLCGFLSILALTSNFTIGLNPDSVAYIAAARNFSQGRGFTVLYDQTGEEQLNLWLPMHDNETYHVLPWPPFYPLLLSIPLFFNLDIVEGARWISAILFGLNIFLIIFIIRKLTNSYILSIIAGLIFLSSKELIHVFTFAWSETIFFFTGFLGLYFLIRYIDNLKYSYLITSAILIAVTSYTRTAGVAFIVLAVIAILFFTKTKITKKILDSGIYFIISVIPALSWALWTGRINKTSNYELIYHPPKIVDYRLFVHTSTSWFLPGRTPFIYQITAFFLFILFITIILILFVTKFKNNKNIINNKLNLKVIFLLIIYSILHFLILLISKSFLDANVPIVDARTLSPIQISVIIIIVLTSKIIIDLWGHKKQVKFATLSILCLLILLHIITISFGPLIKKIYYNGQLYTSSESVNSETIEELKKLPEDSVIYTNEPDAVYILTDRNPKILPAKYNIYTGKENIFYSSQLNLISDLKGKNNFIVFFDSGWYFIVKENELKEHLTLIKDTEDGAIYRTGQ